jgi:hypothetical protein
VASADVATANAKATAINLIIVFSMSSIQVEISSQGRHDGRLTGLC